ncbi:NUDIX domain-containing protein [Oceanobacillus sp. FSL H7-0719]|uniref:NUDIX hydrolase n=1 Tax=Oceanobacillus sp. FSL H7-0719 TaxID=2954507 RepID=UPI003251412A
MRDRGSAVIIEGCKVALIQRIVDGSVYYVFPGGGIENGETPEEATRREAFEELGVEVKVKERIATVYFNGTQYYFLSEIINGTFGTGNGEEYTDKERYDGTHLPIWADINSLSSMDIIPKEVAFEVQSRFK